MSKSLLEITNGILLAMLDVEEGGEISPEFDEYLNQLYADQEQKLDEYIHVIRTLEGEAAIAEREAESFKEMAKKRRNRVEYLKKRLMDHMQAVGMTQVKTALARTIRVQNNGGVDPVEVSIPVEQLPKKYVRVKTEYYADKELLREELKNGKKIEGVTLGQRGKRLVIS